MLDILSIAALSVGMIEECQSRQVPMRSKMRALGFGLRFDVSISYDIFAFGTVIEDMMAANSTDPKMVISRCDA